MKATVSSHRFHLSTVGCGLVLAAAAAVAYGRTFSVPWLYDDEGSILRNLSIRHLATAFAPPIATTVNGRPLLNLSFAINYRLSGTSVWSYHGLNLAIHILAGLTLLGIIRRTLALEKDPAALAIAFSIALLWALHPLQTESVTYAAQRAESLMGLFYLLTLYFFIRGATAPGSRQYLGYTLSVAACLLGMATKEVMATAPLAVLLFDRTFLAGSFAEAWRRRRGFYLALAATWLALAFFVLTTHGRGGSAGFESGISAWKYALTQFPAICHYLRLSFWPRRLVFDYGNALVTPSTAIIPHALIVAGLLAASVWASCKRLTPGFLGASFFLILAPSSSIIPIATETVAEHRMYLPLACLISLAVIGIYRITNRAALPICLLVASALLACSYERNDIFRSEERLWRDTAAKLPGNERAQYNLGCILAVQPGKADEAIGHFQEALRLRPDYVEAHYNLARTLQNLPGRTDQAIRQYREALRLRPDVAETYCNLGCALATTPDGMKEAISMFRMATRLKPDFAEAHFDLGNALFTAGRAPEAAAEYLAALRTDPEDEAIHLNLAIVLLDIPGRKAEAIAHLEEVRKRQPGNSVVRRLLDRIGP